MKKGFTLTETIIAVLIITIILSVTMIGIFRAIEKSKVARLVADREVIKNATVRYYNDVGIWPPDVYPHEDPGFMSWNAYSCACGGQDFDLLPSDYATRIQTNWSGPYLDKFDFRSPWAGSYDYEFWPGGWGDAPNKVPAGVYLSVRPYYKSKQVASTAQGTTCASGSGYCPDVQDSGPGEVPDRFERLLQRQRIDVYTPSGINTPDGIVVVTVMGF